MILDDFSIQVNYFLRESDLGSPVAAACAPRFREMNALAEIEVLSAPRHEELAGVLDKFVRRNSFS